MVEWLSAVSRLCDMPDISRTGLSVHLMLIIVFPNRGCNSRCLVLPAKAVTAPWHPASSQTNRNGRAGVSGYEAAEPRPG